MYALGSEDYEEAGAPIGLLPELAKITYIEWTVMDEHNQMNPTSGWLVNGLYDF
jgi:hypothetical protein